MEWWYVTGWLDQPYGFQITFFRARPEEESANPSSFNPRQVLFAHAALADPKRGRLVHEQRAARAGFSLAYAETERTGVWIDDWSLVLEGTRYQAHIAAREFEFDFTFFAHELVLQGDAGFSRSLSTLPDHESCPEGYYHQLFNLYIRAEIDDHLAAIR